MRTFAMPHHIDTARDLIGQVVQIVQEVQPDEEEITAQLREADKSLAGWADTKRAELEREIQTKGCDVRTDFIVDYCATCGAGHPTQWATCPGRKVKNKHSAARNE